MELFKNMEERADKHQKTGKDEETEKVRCLIIGSGPAGYTAAIYAARANLKPLLYEGLQPGGQLTTTTDVENFPGYPEGISGPVMMEDLKKQAERFGTDTRWGIATAADLSRQPYRITIDDKHIVEADTLIIATGATAKYLGMESEQQFMGHGVSACATCDGFFYRGQDVAVVGGGDSACEEALYLSGLCKKVYMLVRRNVFRASRIMADRVMNTPNIEVLFEHEPKEVVGEQNVDGVIVHDKKRGKEYKLEVQGFFLAIGHKPNSDVFRDYLETDDVGYIKTTPGTSKTSLEGVFACGDVQDSHYRQAVTAAGSGCMAAMDAERYLGEKGL
jgi:thioredoxin reductase (NADPH)